MEQIITTKMTGMFLQRTLYQSKIYYMIQSEMTNPITFTNYLVKLCTWELGYPTGIISAYWVKKTTSGSKQMTL